MEPDLNDLDGFSNSLSNLALKTPEQRKILKTSDTKQPKTASKVTFEPPPGSFNITFDTSESESEDEALKLTSIVSPTQKTPEKPLQGITVFVDVRAENENRSKAISRELERLGACVADKIGSHITHVVFKDGRNGTLTQLKKFSHIHFVSVLWVDACKTIGCKVNEGLYPARNPQEEANRIIPAKTKRVKSLQPKTFEEDINNSAKKEDRRRKRLKKLNKDFDTPIDRIICLDSQEYIKSSDLHKLVATPLAIPDTPWILHYINGTGNESKISPNDLCSKLDDSNEEMKDLSQSVQCKLNFETSPRKQSSCLIDIGFSPSEKQLPSSSDRVNIITAVDSPQKVKKISKTSKVSSTITRADTPAGIQLNKQADSQNKGYSELTSISTIDTNSNINKAQSQKESSVNSLRREKGSIRKSLRSSTTSSPSNTYPKSSFEQININNKTNKIEANIKKSKEDVNKKNIENEGKVDCHNVFVDASHPNAMSSPLKRKSPAKEKRESIEKETKKKKKRLLSKSRFLLPQEKLISPALKNNSNNDKENKKESPKKKKQPPLNVSNKSTQPNTYTLLQNLTNSKMIVDMEEEKQIKIISSSKQTCKVADISNSYTSFIEENLLNSKDQPKDSNPPPPTKSLCLKIAEEPPSYEEKEAVVAKHVFRRRSERLNTRRSSVDFEVSQKFRKQKQQSDATEIKETTSSVSKQVISSEVPEEFSFMDNKPLDLNVSFVHDEEEGLICTSQTTGTVFKLEDRFITSNSAVVGATGGDGKEVDEEERVVREVDSGISDSEDMNAEEQLPTSPLVRPCKTSSSSKNQSFTQMKGKQDTSMNRSTVSNQSLNRSTTSKKLKHSVVCTSLHFGEQDFVKGVIKQLKDFQLKKNVAPDTTHVIAGTSRRTLNVLHGITQGCWIISPKWVSDSFEANCWLPEEAYEMHKEFNAAKIPRIFLAEVTSPPHEELMKLIVSCGGQLTNAIRKAGIAIGLVNCRRDDIRILSEKWILDSITNGRIISVEKYQYRMPLQRERSPDY